MYWLRTLGTLFLKSVKICMVEQIFGLAYYCTIDFIDIAIYRALTEQIYKCWMLQIDTERFEKKIYTY